MISIMVVGGTGHWAEKHYFHYLLRLRQEGYEFRVSIICDLDDPYAARPADFAIGRGNLATILQSDRPLWCAAARHDAESTLSALDDLIRQQPIDLVVIACGPERHFAYAKWAVERGINVICEKPPFLVPGAGSDLEAAQVLSRQFDTLGALLERQRAEHPGLVFYIPLKNRRLIPYRTIACGLTDVFERTGQGLTHLTMIVNNGLHRYPVEFLNAGAHGYVHGFGSASHSTYHYLDLVTWFLSCAKGKVARLGLSVPYVHRVRDYLRGDSYRGLAAVLGDDGSTDLERLDLSERLLGAELDLQLNLALYDEENNKLGLISYHSNHMSFSPRTLPCDPSVIEPGNHALGGKMRQVFMDIHQGPLQHFMVQRDHVNGESKRFSLTRRLHPELGAPLSTLEIVDSLYSPGQSPGDVLRNLFKRILGRPVDKAYAAEFERWNQERLTHILFSRCYEQIAASNEHRAYVPEEIVEV